MSDQSEETQLALLRNDFNKHELLDETRWTRLDKSISTMNRTGLGVIFGIMAWLAVQLYSIQSRAIEDIRKFQPTQEQQYRK